MEKTHRFYYGWVIVVVSFFTLFLTLGIHFSFGVFYVAILKEYAWGRAETAGAFSLVMLTQAFFAIVTGHLIDRLGPRRLFPLGATFLAMGLAAASRITAIWHLYLFFGVVTAIGMSTLSFPPHMSRIPQWFIRKRGLASGLVAAGVGVGIMVMAPISQLMIDIGGWRFAFLVLGGIVIGVIVPMTALFQRRSPEEVGQFPDGIVPGSGGTHSLQRDGFPEETQFSHLSGEWTLRAALCSSGFWWMGLSFFCVGFATSMLVVHQAAYIVDAGYGVTLAALLVGLLGLLRSMGGILFGYLSDRVDREIACTLGGSAAFVGVVIFLLIRDTTSPWMLYAFVIVLGLGHGSTGPINIATLADLFPGNALGRIIGASSIGHALGGTLGPYLGGYFYDHTESYTVPFLLVMVSFSLWVFTIWMAAPRHRRTPSVSQDG